jgi:hypothetical protein
MKTCENDYKVNIRHDRTGAQFYALTSQYMLSQFYKKNIYIDRIVESPLSDFFVPYVNDIKVLTSQNQHKDLIHLAGVRNAAAELVQLVKSDLITYSKFHMPFNLLNIKKIKRIDCDNSHNFKTNQIVIHIRNGDVQNQPIHNGLKVHNYCRSLIHDLCFNEKYDRKKQDFLGSDMQCPTSEFSLDILLEELCFIHPQKEIHIVSESKKMAKSSYRNLSKKYNIKFFSDGIFKDFYHLATANTLIGSRSTFCIMALYYFIGERFYYPHWSLYSCLGLDTKFDNTGYIPFLNSAQ